MKVYIQAVFLSLLCSCATNKLIIETSIQTIPQYPITPAPEHFLLANSYDISEQKFRENKEKLFINLTDTILLEISNNINESSGIRSTILP
jgi:hypothetical protein